MGKGSQNLSGPSAEPLGTVEGYSRIDRFLWPSRDRDCKAVIFGELKKMEQVLKAVISRNVVVQAGGNCGVFPYYLAGMFDRVYTFEPEPENFHCLVANVTAPNVIKIQGALGNSYELLDVHGEHRNCGAYQVKPGRFIPTFRVDDLGLDACDFLCLDVEGSEHDALMGARHTLERFHPVLLYEDKGIKTKQDEIGLWLEAEFGYQLQRLPRDVIAT